MTSITTNTTAMMLATKPTSLKILFMRTSQKSRQCKVNKKGCLIHFETTLFSIYGAIVDFYAQNVYNTIDIILDKFGR